MKRILLAIILILPALGFGVDFSGFVDSTFSYVERNDNSVLTNIFASYPNYSFYSTLKLSAKSDNFSVVGRAFVDYVYLTNSFYFDEFYLNFSVFDLVSFKVGRQVLGFGVGYLWNPANSFDLPKDLFSMDKYRIGVDAIKVNFDFSKFTDVPFNISTFLLPPVWEANSRIDLSYSKVGAYSYVFINPFEFGFTAGYQRLTNDREDVAFGVFCSVDVLGSIVGVEASASRKNEVFFINQSGEITNYSDFFMQSLVTFNRRISEKSFLVFEYYYNNFGFSNEEVERLFDTLKTNVFVLSKFYDRFTPGNLSKNNVFVGVSWEVIENLGVSLSALCNLDRLGVLLYPVVSYSISDNFDVSFEVSINFASDKRSEISEAIYKNFYSLRFVGYF
jgi:hypothetical protein